MNMNKLTIALVAILVLFLASCGNRQFQINGCITEAADSVLYLENVGLDEVTVLDSVKLDKEGMFVFSEDATDAPEFYRLRIAGKIINLSIDSTETVGVKAVYPSMAYDYEVSGSENCSKIKELALRQMRLQANINSIIKDPALKVSVVNDSIAKTIDAYKEQVRTEIYKAPNMAYSYFALFQTVVVGNSYNLIFNPRTNEDDVKVFAAVATSWDTFHPGALRGENLHNIALEGMKNVRIIKARENMTIDASKIDTSGVVDIELVDNKGNMRKLSELKGKVVLLDFCSFAQEGVTERIMVMREVYNKFHSQGLEIYQVSLDGNEHFWKTQTAALPWVSVNDPAGAASQYVVKYNVMVIPTFYLIDKTGTPVKRDEQIKNLEAEIKALL